MANRIPTVDELRSNLAKSKPGRFLESMGLLGVISCIIAGIVIAYKYKIGGPAMAILLGIGALFGLAAGVLAYWVLLFLLGYHRKSLASSQETKRRSLTSDQRLARTRQRHVNNEMLSSHQAVGTTYSDGDFACPSSMPGRKTKVGSHFCDFYHKSGEVAFAVVEPPFDANALELKKIGERLQAWQTCNEQARRILGLEELLQGTLPTLRADMFSLAAMSERVHVALIYVSDSADNESTGETLLQVFAGLAVHVVSPGCFSKLRE